MPLNQMCVDQAIRELEEVVCAGETSSEYVHGASVAKSSDSYFVATQTALISMKSVARLAYIKCRMPWDTPHSAKLSRNLMQSFGVVVIHDATLAEGLRNLEESMASQPRWKYAKTKARLDQARFRGLMLQVFNGKCVLSGCGEPVALEACHVIPFAEEGVDEGKNGLLLRADLHLLFDNGLLSVCPETCKWHFAERLRSDYEALHGIKMSANVFRAREQALIEHWEGSGLGG